MPVKQVDRNIRRVVFLDTLAVADQLAAADAEPGVEPDRSALIRKLVREEAERRVDERAKGKRR